jgi:hypothetical protein
VLAGDFARLAVANVTREFPYAPAHVVSAANERRLPRELHPAFYGSYDWHSAVHMHWLLVRLLTRYGVGLDGRVAAVLDAHLTEQQLGREADYLRRHPGFERPYGWAWLLTLAAECDTGGERAAPWAAALRPAAAAVEELVLDWLPRQNHPVRHGTHANTAFACGLLLDSAVTLRRDGLAAALRDRASAWFLADRGYPAEWEPSGEDFLSGALTEADLMRRLLDSNELAAWLGGFLPGLESGRPAGLLQPVCVGDPKDGRIGHLHGLNLSRAAAMSALAAALPDGDPRATVLSEAAGRHVAASLPAVASGGYLGDHWLATFAARAVDGSRRGD